DLSCLFHSLDTVWLTADIERFISQQGHVQCKFPWSDDYTIGRTFWLTLACLDPSRKGWLSEEHIDLWVDYMWHGRPDNAKWAMFSCYFERLPVILLGAKVFDKKGIDPTDYCIRFKLADSVPKQGGVRTNRRLPRVQNDVEVGKYESKLLRIVVHIIPSFLHSSNHSNDLETELSFVLSRTSVYGSVQLIRRIRRIPYDVSDMNQLQQWNVGSQRKCNHSIGNEMVRLARLSP
ncbi:hypothetical protein Tco_0915620, partial [Tanacetum coccineum]